MTWWRRLWQQLRGRTPVSAAERIQAWEMPQADAATRGARSEFRAPRPAAPSSPRPQAAPPAVEREPVGAPIADRPIKTPPRPATPVVIAAPKPTPAPVNRAHVAAPTELVPVAKAAPDKAPDAPFELPDFSSIAYPDVPGGFASPVGGRRRRQLHDAGYSRFAVGATEKLLAELEAAERHVDLALAREPIVLSLPVRGSTPQVYAIDALPQQFMVAPTGEPRVLAVALSTATDPDPDSADALDRLELTRLVALLLDGLHAQQHFTSGVGPASFAFCLHPRPSIALLRGDQVRRVGGDFLASTASLDATPSLDNDRHGFARLAHRLLVTPDGPSASTIPGLDEAQTRAARRLWQRSDGPAGTRPQVREWMGVLGL